MFRFKPANTKKSIFVEVPSFYFGLKTPFSRKTLMQERL